jgi:hypothetical protein
MDYPISNSEWGYGDLYRASSGYFGNIGDYPGDIDCSTYRESQFECHYD